MNTKLTWHKRNGVFREFGQRYRWEFAANKGKYVVRYGPHVVGDWHGDGDWRVLYSDGRGTTVKGGFVNAASARDWAEEHHRLSKASGGRLAGSLVDSILAKNSAVMTKDMEAILSKYPPSKAISKRRANALAVAAAKKNKKRKVS